MYHLFEDQRNIQDSPYTNNIDFLVFFSDSIWGLQVGAPVEFHGIRLGTVAEVPFIIEGLNQTLNNDYRVPVLIRIEPERFVNRLGQHFNIKQNLKDNRKYGLCASLKIGNLLSGSLYIDLDFYNNVPVYKVQDKISGYETIPTIRSSLSQIQQKLVAGVR